MALEYKTAHRDVGQAMLRGMAGRCPNCGKGRLFRRYLKVQPTCESCQADLAQFRADDGPAYLTILLVGHLVVAPLLLFPIVWESSPWISLPAILIPLLAITLVTLPRIKGGWVGLMYSLGVTDRDQRLHTADAAD